MELTSLAYQTDIGLLQLGGSRVDDRGDYLVVRSPHNPAHWWGNFLLLTHVPPPERSQSWLDRFAHTLVMVADPDYFAIDLYRLVGFAPAETQLQIERPRPPR